MSTKILLKIDQKKLRKFPLLILHYTTTTILYTIFYLFIYIYNINNRKKNTRVYAGVRVRARGGKYSRIILILVEICLILGDFEGFSLDFGDFLPISDLQMLGAGGRICFVDGQKHSRICRRKGAKTMAVTVDSMTTKYKTLGTMVKTIPVQDSYFEDDGNKAEALTNDIKKIYDTDTTITGFVGILETKYTIAD